MSVEELKQELATLDATRRNEILAFLVSLNDRENPERLAKISRILDDKDPSRWLTLEEVEKRLGLGPYATSE
jgi:hypothetical protein